MRVPRLNIQKLVSGGQTGADRAALDFAIFNGIQHGGWCPLGRLAEDGVISARYELIETPSAEYAQRTEWNVRDSDATVIFSLSPVLSGGSQLTLDIAGRLGRPFLHLFPKKTPGDEPEALRAFVVRNRVRVLNVAGPRASTEPGVGVFVGRMLSSALLQEE